MGMEDIKNTLMETFPTLEIKSLERLGAGYDSVAYLVNGRWVFKFPQNEQASHNLQKEIAVLKQIHDKLPLRVPKPEFIGGGIYGYEKLPGVILTPKRYRNLEAVAKQRVAQDLAAFLQVLHRLKLSVPVEDLELDYREKFLEDLADLRDFSYPLLADEERGYVEAVFSEVLADPQFFDYEPVLCHQDLSADHLLYDEKSQRLCGVIDFGDVAWTDPAYDFHYLLEDSEEEYGKEFGLQVLAAYGGLDVGKVLNKCRFFHEVYWPFEQLIMGHHYSLSDWFLEGLESIRKASACLE